MNHCLDFLKRKKIQTVELKEEVYDRTEEESWEVEQEISLETIIDCIEELPMKCKNVVKLYLLEGYDHQEVAQILQISEVASRSQLSRGKNRLKELLMIRNHEN